MTLLLSAVLVFVLGAAAAAVLPANYSASVTASWDVTVTTLKVEPSIQLVTQARLLRGSDIHDVVFSALAALRVKHARLATWFPYAATGVAELMPPSGAALCGPANWATPPVLGPISLDCGPTGGVISSIDFASFGRPTGVCGAFARNPACHAPSSVDVVSAACLGQAACTLQTGAQPSPYGPDPCFGQTKWLAVQVTCSNPAARHSYWNMTLLDALFTDFWSAVDGDRSAPIPSFSTQPTWMYDSSSYAWQEDPAVPWYGYDTGVAPAANLTVLGDYYGRLVSYFVRGGFEDEYGVAYMRPAGPVGSMPLLEIFNEVDYEHAHTAVSYTLDFDAVVSGVRRWADPGRSINFVGLCLPNIDDTAKVVAWSEYFLNASNHAPDVRDALNYIGYHAYPTAGTFTPDPTTFAGMFDYADDFVDNKVAQVDAVIARLSPTTLTFLDETGTDMDQVLNPELPVPANAPRYWVASAGYFAYMFCRVARASATVRSLGASQLMDAPGQEPSVTMLDWVSGNGTARYWVVKLLRDTTSQGDALVHTNSSNAALFAQGFVAAAGGARAMIVVNKLNAWATVDLSGACPAATCTCTGVSLLDEFTGLAPPRREGCTAGPGLLLAPYAVAAVSFAAAGAAA